MVTTCSCRKPRKGELKLNCGTWKYSKTPRVLRLTVPRKGSPGAINPVFKILMQLSMDDRAFTFRR
jgi:hypothetical protein